MSTKLAVLAVLSALLIPLSSACNPQDLSALLAFKNSFPGNPFPASWNPSVDCCSWDYIQCDATTGRVTTLSINDNSDLKGPIPPAIGNLTALQVVSFQSDPHLSGGIPNEFARLTSLQYLTIYSTSVGGTIPGYFATFTKLVEINLINSKFEGAIPPTIGYLNNLVTLDLSGNKLTGSIPSTLFSQYTGSKADLDLSNNSLTGAIPKSFGSVGFFNVNLNTNKLTGDASFLFGASKPTLQIILSYNQLAFNLTGVEYPLGLNYLDLNHNQIYGGISSQITQLTSLNYFDVSYNQLCGKIPTGGNFKPSASAFAHNKCLCGTPLPPCK